MSGYPEVMGTPVAIILLGLLVACAAAAILVLLTRVREGTVRLDRVLSETASARQASESVDRRFEELRRSVAERVEGVERSLQEGQRHLSDHLGQSGQLLKDVGEKMGRIFEASQKIEKLAGEVTRLEDLLKPPKLRGTLGETFLEQALREALPPGSWQMQYRFADDGSIVDAVVSVGDRFVPIDSKFPLENYRRARELEDESEQRRARAAFVSDVKRHADAIARKYIRPAAGTYDYAFMYVPAESVYAEIVADESEKALADYCIERRVFPVSPRLFYAYLSTVAMVLRGQELQRNAQDVAERLSELARTWARAEEPFKKLGTHLGNAAKQYEEASAALNRFGQRLEGVSDGAERTLVQVGETLPLLPPS